MLNCSDTARGLLPTVPRPWAIDRNFMSITLYQENVLFYNDCQSDNINKKFYNYMRDLHPWTRALGIYIPHCTRRKCDKHVKFTNGAGKVELLFSLLDMVVFNIYTWGCKGGYTLDRASVHNRAIIHSLIHTRGQFRVASWQNLTYSSIVGLLRKPM